MALINVEKLVPEVYVEESRDFQLLCRLYSIVFSSMKYDIEQIQNIVDTKYCRERILKLLQTKLGFFTTTSVTDEELRYVLEAFPVIMKYKGSLKAVQMSIATFLKAKHITADYAVQYVTENSAEEQTGLKPYTIGISINTSLVSHELLQALLKYVVPAGFNIAIYFFNKIEVYNDFVYNHGAKVLYVYYRDNSKLRARREQDNSHLIDLREKYGRMDPTSGETEGKYYADELVNAVDTVYVATRSELIDFNINRYKIDEYVPNSILNVQEISNRLNSYLLSSKDAVTFESLGYIPIVDDKGSENGILTYDQVLVLGGCIPRYDKTRRHEMTYYSELVPYELSTVLIEKENVTIDLPIISSQLDTYVYYTFEYDDVGKCWYLNDKKVNLDDYGISISFTQKLEDGAQISIILLDERGTIDHVTPVNHVFNLNDCEDSE